ncbi:DUF1501 domain-containing protein [Tahibacter amnicola]|uniref:DUF1501 domain-containing protein n=1 Tax=Tahibacter amnicola TaxID=2976241 RepID=A0ABY6B9K0_9GAMM|nr:DUF1501 domain-containing protein [Tahibacter amnicola]UXI66743.1 DUF1501 domain-containing protein [Tahibacter amnicola]
MTHDIKTRRQFLKHLGGLLCAGGASAFMPQLQLIGSATAATRATVPGYRALVCVYLAGGNDAYNTLIPYDTARHAAYVSARGGVYHPNTNPQGLAIARDALTSAVQITDSATGAPYALNPGNANYPAAMAELANLFRQNKLAFIANVGTLTRRITKDEYNALPALRPPQLYSHNDQENLWHLGRTTNYAQGWGGQVADRVRLDNLNQQLSPCISVYGGTNRFQVGLNTFPYHIDSSGVVPLSNIYNDPDNVGSQFGMQLDGALDRMLAQSYPSPFSSEYAGTFKRARAVYDLLYPALASAAGQITTEFPSNDLGEQLKMVARMIRLSRDTSVNVQHKRQIYFVRLAGFDMHDKLMNGDTAGHAYLLNALSKSLSAFWQAMNEIGAQNEVTAFTMSEFARTLSSNGNGSDHAWGGVQLVMGGAVNGGRIYGTYPELVLNGPMSLSRGQMIPTTSVDQMAATLARWMGVTGTNDLRTIFPNLINFDTDNLGFMTA